MTEITKRMFEIEQQVREIVETGARINRMLADILAHDRQRAALMAAQPVNPARPNGATHG
jgi:hypothetical protein